MGERRQTKRRVVLLALCLVAIGSVGGIAYRQLRLLPRAIPQIDLQGVHPEVADAIRAARDTVRRQPRSASAWGRLGMVLHAHEYYAQAVACYETAGRLDAQESRWPYLLANLRETDDRSAALAAYRRAVEIQPEYAQPRVRLAELLMDLGQADEAEGELMTALELAPRNGQAQYRLAQLMFQRRDLESSLAWATKAAGQPPPRREIHELLLQLYHRLGQSDKAEEQAKLLRAGAFAQGYWPDPYFEDLKRLRRDPRWMTYQAQLLLAQGRASEGLAILDELVQQQPQDPYVREHLARAFIKVDELGLAAGVLDQGLHQAPQSLDLHRLRGAVHLLKGEWPQAMKQYQAALELKPDDAASHEDLGYCLAQVGELDRAVKELREAIRTQPDAIQARLEIAKILLQQGQSEPARVELEAIFKMSPQNPAARALLQSIEGRAKPDDIPLQPADDQP
jgi:tetratricopeptide (TPR) repeat protein